MVVFPDARPFVVGHGRTSSAAPAPGLAGGRLVSPVLRGAVRGLRGCVVLRGRMCICCCGRGCGLLCLVDGGLYCGGHGGQLPKVWWATRVR